MTEREKKAGAVPAATASTERKEVAVVRMMAGGTRQIRSTFHFDDVLTSFSTQEEVFSATLQPLVHQVLAGYEATAFAYGQTGTGKTYTMEGELDSEDGRGLVPRAAAEVINRLSSGEFTETAVTVSYLEIYNEELSDLLVPQQSSQPQTKLDLKDVGGGRGVVCIGLSEVPVSTLDEILELVRRAQERRRVAETRVNARSSRSHCIFTMKVRCRRKVSVGELENVGKLHLVDLAGSECAKKASSMAAHYGEEASPMVRSGGPQASADEDRERRSINQSLLTLGRVIAALRDQSGRVPYRDSKLTRLLQDALGGKCKTVVIATLSPALLAVDETISTLTYAEQASGIRNRPVTSSLLRTTRMPLPADLSRVAAECGGLGASNSGCGASDWAELEMKVVYMTQEVEEAQAALARKYLEVQELVGRADAAEQQLEGSRAQLEEAQLSAREAGFVRDHLATFAGRQSEAACRFAVAFDAAAAHGGDLSRLLGERGAAMAEMRQQCRALCADSASRADSLAAAGREGAAEAAKEAEAVHAAHRDAVAAAAELAGERHRILDDLAAAAKAGGAQWSEALHQAAERAREALESGQVAGHEALGKLEASATAADAAATKGRDELRAAAAQGEARLAEQSQAITTDLDSGREALSAEATAIVGDLRAAAQASQSASDASLAQVQGTIRQPMASLQSSLQEALGAAERHAGELATLRDRTAEGARTAAERRQSFVAALDEASRAHEEAAAARPPPLREALGALQGAVASRGSALESSLQTASGDVAAANTRLAEASESGSTSVADAVAGADARLSAAWEVQRQGQEELSVQLARAVAEQRAANASGAVTAKSEAAGTTLGQAAAAAAAAFAAVREDVAREVAELQALRASEQRIIAILQQQREALQGDVAELRSTLEACKAEVATTRTQLTELQATQERSCGRALEAITSVVKAQLNSLSQELDEATTSACSRLDAATSLAGKVQEAASEAQERSASAGRSASDAASAWSQGTEAKCGNLRAAQERAGEAAQGIDRVAAVTVAELKGIGGAAVAWGGACDRVAEMTDGAADVVGELRSARGQFQPSWQEARDRTLDFAKQWASQSRDVNRSLEGVAATVAAAETERSKLGDEVTQHHMTACAHIDRWVDSDVARKASFEELSRLRASHDEEVAAHESWLRSHAGALNEEQARLSSGAAEASRQASGVLEAVDSFVSSLPSQAVAATAAMDAAGTSIGQLSGREEARLSHTVEALTGLQQMQSESVREMCGTAATAAEAVTASVAAGLSALQGHREALVANSTQAGEGWGELEVECASALAALEAAVQAALEHGAGTDATANQRMASLLEQGSDANAKTLANFSRLASSASAALAEQQAKLQGGLAAAPLAAFDATEQAVPEWPVAARRPDVEILPKPCERQLAAEFRATLPLGGKENERVREETDPNKVKDANTVEGRRPSHPSVCRKVLGELNEVAA